LKVVKKRNLGLRGRDKMALQILVGLVVGAAVYWSSLAQPGQYSTRVIIPFFKTAMPDLGVFYVLFAVMVLVGASNAVNMTDGLDGLAIGCTLIAAAAFTGLAYVSGHRVFSEYLDLLFLPRAGEVTIFCGAMVGASMGFLWWNCYPAQIFMGDVGSLALGGALGTVAILIKQELLLPLVGGVFVFEAVSVILQVASFKLRGKRIFRMAPIHHHFELIGWAEPQIITRFLIAAFVFALFAITTLKLR
jgi:phospho-N-acetylmuramoyl-pentapeptide-transferase